MNNLQPSSLLISNGWEHVANLTSYAEAESVKTQLELSSLDSYEYTLGGPKGGAKHSAHVLKTMGMVGLYKRSGKTVRRDSLDIPSLSFSEDPPQNPIPTIPSRERKRGAYDRPLKPVMAAVKK